MCDHPSLGAWNGHDSFQASVLARKDDPCPHLLELKFQYSSGTTKSAPATIYSISIGFSGRIEGRCRIGLTSTAARTVMEALVGDLPECTESMIDDAAGELCNMIVGSWKSQLPPAHAAALLSIPSPRTRSQARSTTARRRRSDAFTISMEICSQWLCEFRALPDH